MSVPSTPPSEIPSHKDSRFKPSFAACEHPDTYRPSGYCPVDLGDVLQGRYRVVRKLGYGSSATVWLAEDTLSPNTYVALKIHTAGVDVSNELSIQQHLAAASSDPDSDYVLLLSTSSIIESPKGKHWCFIMEPMGPDITAVLTKSPEIYDPRNPPSRRFPTPQTRRILRNILSGLRFLHKNNIVHGDLQPRNFLFSLQPSPGSRNWEQDASKRQRGRGQQLYLVERLDGKIDKWAPKYLTIPKPLAEDEVGHDQGGAPAFVATPASFRAPEVILHGNLGPAIDIWSFGCLMFELLTELPIFELIAGLDRNTVDDDHLISLSQVIGVLPGGLPAKWPRYSKYFGPGGERLDSRPLDFDTSSMGRRLQAHEGKRSRDPPTPEGPMADKFHRHKPKDIDEAESRQIASLLESILQLDPSKRPSAADLLSHPWFKMEA